MYPEACAARFPVSWGAAGGSALPQAPAPLLGTSPERAMSKGSQRNLRWEGSAGDLLSRLSLVGPSSRGSLFALQLSPAWGRPQGLPLSPSQLCSRRGGGCSTVLPPKPTVNFPNKGQFLHAWASSVPMRTWGVRGGMLLSALPPSCHPVAATRAGSCCLIWGGGGGNFYGPRTALLQEGETSAMGDAPWLGLLGSGEHGAAPRG